MSVGIVPVTVIVVAYNHARYIEECLRSIAGQTVAPERVIIFDDCSPDDSAQVARSFVAENGLDWDVVRNAENRGLCTTLNTALATVDTEYYAYISADDTMLPERIARQYAQFSTAKATVALSYSDAYRIDADSVRLPEDFSEAYDWPARADREGWVFRTMVRRNWIPAPSVMLRTAAVREIGGYDPDLFFEDNDLWLRLARQYEFCCIDAELVEFRELSTSLGNREFQSESLRFLEAYRRMLVKHLDVGGDSQQAVGVDVWNLAYRFWRAGGRGRENAWAMRRAARYSPRPSTAYIYAALASIGLSGRRR